MKKLMLPLLLALSVTSCSNKETEIEQQRAVQYKIDSTRSATQQEAVNQMEAKRRKEELQAEAKREASRRIADVSYVKSQIASFQADLVIAEDNLENAKTFRLLRSSDDRENQIRFHLHKVREINDVIEQWQDLILEIQSGSKYEMPGIETETDYQKNTNLVE